MSDDDGEHKQDDLDDLLKVVSIDEARKRLDAMVSRSGKKLRPFAWRRNMPRRTWLYGQTLQRGYINAIAAPGGLGKTALCMVIACALASGKPLLGEHVPRPCRVAYMSLEDDDDEQQRRFQAACMAHSLNEADLRGNLFPINDLPLKLVAIARNHRPEFLKEAKEYVIAMLRESAIDVLIIDPLKRVLIADETNEVLDLLLEGLSEIARKASVGILVVHHTRKMIMGAAASIDDIRGGTALVNGTRHAEILQRIPDAEADTYGLSQKDRTSVFRCVQSKSNMAPVDIGNRWFKLVSIELDNEGPDGEPGDSVQSVRLWHPPQVGADRIGEDGRSRLIGFLKRGGPWRMSGQVATDQRIHDAFVSVFGWDLDNKRDRSDVDRIVKAWLASGVLVRDEVKVKGRMVPFVRPGEA